MKSTANKMPTNESDSLPRSLDDPPAMTTPKSDSPKQIPHLLGLSETAQPPITAPIDSVSRPPSIWRAVFITLLATFVCGAIIWYAGYLYRTQGLPPPATTDLSSLPADSIVARNGVVMTLDRNGPLTRVVIQQPGDNSWLLISRDAVVATSVALSPDGTHVAYVTDSKSHQVVVISVTGVERLAIMSDDLSRLGGNVSWKVCPWTPIGWSPDGSQLAFFSCGSDQSHSIAIVGVITTSPAILDVVAGSEINFDHTRQLVWNNDSQLYLTMPVSGTQQSFSMTLFDIR